MDGYKWDEFAPQTLRFECTPAARAGDLDNLSKNKKNKGTLFTLRNITSCLKVRRLHDLTRGWSEKLPDLWMGHVLAGEPTRTGRAIPGHE
jgi:hypothetical protein